MRAPVELERGPAGRAESSPWMDRYPSRTEGHPVFRERLDPVVYGTAEDGPLDEARLKAYETDGFLAFPSLLTPEELAEAVAELERLREDPAILSREEAVTEPGSQALRSVFALHRQEGVLRRLCHHPRLVAIARQLLGSDVYLHQSRVNYKPGFSGKEFFWHSDFETWHVEDGMPAMRAVSCSISLTENLDCNGPLMVVPGSHKSFLACVGETPEEHFKQSLKKQEYGVPDPESLTKMVEGHGIVSLKGPPGSVTFFDCNIMHGSSSNISPFPRHNVFMVFNSVDNRLAAPFCGLPPRPWFIGEREDYTPVPFEAFPA